MFLCTFADEFKRIQKWIICINIICIQFEIFRLLTACSLCALKFYHCKDKIGKMHFEVLFSCCPLFFFTSHGGHLKKKAFVAITFFFFVLFDQVELDSALSGVRDRETQSLELSAELARLTADQESLEQRLRQAVRQKDVAQLQEDQLKLQLAQAQSSAALVPRLQQQVEVS